MRITKTKDEIKVKFFVKKKELENLVISCLFGNNSHNNNNNHMKQSVKIMSKLND